MKKARIVLAMIITSGIIGGLLALKEKSAFNGTTYYVTYVRSAIATQRFPFGATTDPERGIYYFYTLVFSRPATWTGYLTTAFGE